MEEAVNPDLTLNQPTTRARSCDGAHPHLHSVLQAVIDERSRHAGLVLAIKAESLVAVGRWYDSSNQNIFGADRNPGLNAVGFFVGFERAR